MQDHRRTPVLERLVRAVDSQDLDALTACFAKDYVNRSPAHPARGFTGREQVRRNWTQIFASVPDVRGKVTRTAVDGQSVWSEWELAGTRTDRSLFLMRGVVIFQVAEDSITAATFYLEPVEHRSGGADEAARRLAHGSTNSKELQ